MAEAFIAKGHTVLGCGTNPRLLDGLRSAFGPPHDFQAIDVADSSSVAGWASALAVSHDPPDILINNAAVGLEPKPLWKIPERDFARVLDVNVKGTTNMIRAFLPAMLKARRGLIVNISSGWGRSTDANVAPYCATKWAIEGLTQAFAQELPAGMAAVALNPGIINTDMLRQCFGESATGYPKPKRWAEDAVPFILGLGPSHNGQSLAVPGAAIE